MFYEACRCGGVDQKKAKLMYWAVYRFGPRWNRAKATPPDHAEPVAVPRMLRAIVPLPDAEVVEKAEEYFATHDPSLAEIESLEL
jgi:hypothetical protein